MRRALAALLALLLLAAAHPIEQVLRTGRPAAEESDRLGTGRLLGSVLTGPFRPLLRTYLWIRADNLYGQGRIDECVQLERFMVQLYPNNERAREFLGWRLAYNYKSEAPGVALGWRWAEEGLDILARSRDGERWVADWIRKQCGQNSLYLQRYAGRPWEEEKEWRARLRSWGEKRYGKALSRFALGLKAIEENEGAFARWLRTRLLERLAYDELVRFGESGHVEAAVAALRAQAEEFADDPAGHLGPYHERRARLLETLAKGDVPRELRPEDAYEAAVALWGIGARRRNATLLEAAAVILDGLSATDFVEEKRAIGLWREHVRDPAMTPPPPLPFDGMP